MRFAIVNRAAAFILEDDRIHHADEALSGWAVIILEEAGEYARVLTHYGYGGWMRKSDLTETDAAAIRERVRTEDTGSGLQVLTKPFTDVLSIPKVQGRILETLPRGAFVTPVQADAIPDRKEELAAFSEALAEKQQASTELNGYVLVQTAGGQTGYVPACGLMKRQDSDGFLAEAERTGVTEISSKANTWFLRQKTLHTDADGTAVGETASGEISSDEAALRAAVVQTAKTYLGTQYRWSGKTPAGIDCSGLTFMSYFMNGVLIYRDANIVDGWPVHEIPAEQLQEGDMIFFPGHIAMYIGDGRFIHSTGYAKNFGCTINSLREGDPDYRADLPGIITKYGSVF